MLLDNPELRARYGATAARRVREHFSFEAMVGRTFELYQQVMDGNPTSTLIDKGRFQEKD